MVGADEERDDREAYEEAPEGVEDEDECARIVRE